MDEYISREETVKKIKSCILAANDAWESGYNTAMAEIMEWIKHMPTADVQPARFARWIDLDNRILCSGCGAGYDDSDEVKQNTYIFCPNCGARMGGDEASDLIGETNDEP